MTQILKLQEAQLKLMLYKSQSEIARTNFLLFLILNNHNNIKSATDLGCSGYRTDVSVEQIHTHTANLPLTPITFLMFILNFYDDNVVPFADSFTTDNNLMKK